MPASQSTVRPKFSVHDLHGLFNHFVNEGAVNGQVDPSSIGSKGNDGAGLF